MECTFSGVVTGFGSGDGKLSGCETCGMLLEVTDSIISIDGFSSLTSILFIWAEASSAFSEDPSILADGSEAGPNAKVVSGSTP